MYKTFEGVIHEFLVPPSCSTYKRQTFAKQAPRYYQLEQMQVLARLNSNYS